MYSIKTVERRGEKRINRHKPHRSKISMQRKSCCVFGGTAKELCIMSCFRKTRQLIPGNIIPHWTVWRQQSTKSVQNCQSSGVVFHQDNARPHVSLTTRQKLLQFGWDVLPHPPYSLDIALSNSYLFRSL